MVSSPDYPKAPDPAVTAASQTSMNIDTAKAQQFTNAVNQVTPQGSLTYSQDGNRSYVDSNGKTVNIPILTGTTTYSPSQQALYDKSTAAQSNLGDIAVSQSAKIGGLLNTKFDPDQAVSDKITDLGRQRLDPQWAQNEDALRTKLANQGIQPGSQAWNAEMASLDQGRNDAYNELYLSGNQQAFQQALTERQEPLNEISALLSGSQVSQPSFTSTPTSQVAGVDYAGLVNNNYNQQVAQANAATQANGAMLGGLFGLAGAPFQMFSLPKLGSDRRIKQDIQRVGRLDNGLPVYLFRYKAGGPYQIGVMAQDVERVNPDAVEEIGGVKHVDYLVATTGTASDTLPWPDPAVTAAAQVAMNPSEA